MPGGLAERSVVAALHQREPPGWVIADRRDLLVSPGHGPGRRFHTQQDRTQLMGRWRADRSTAPLSQHPGLPVLSP